MPGFNGTGPQGMGPRTGGGRGFCTPETDNNYNTGTYRGIGRRGVPWGGGRGRSRSGSKDRGLYRNAGNKAYTASPYGVYNSNPGQNTQQELDFLKNQADAIEQELAQINKRIELLSDQKKHG